MSCLLDGQVTCLFDLDGVKALHIVMAAVYPRCGYCGLYFLTATNNGLPGKNIS